MKRILTIGCSYSALYYHPNPKWSYTYLLKDLLGFDKLINLGTGGLSPDGCFRILSNYLQNPVAGKPDFIFIQYPSAYRCEVTPDESLLLDNINEDNWWMLSKTAFRKGSDLLRDYEKDKRWTNVNWTDETFELTEKDFEDISLIIQEVRPFPDKRNGSLYTCPELVLKLFPSMTLEFIQTFSNHDMGLHPDVYFKILTDKRQASINYAKNLCLIENLCEMHNIEYAYIDTDFCYIDAGINDYKVPEGFDKPDNSYSIMEYINKTDTTNDHVLEYAKNLISGKKLIKGVSIGALSPTHVDTYPDLHPGKESHRLFAEKIASVIK